jgi:DNA-binding transcriptional regulator GbsR (MarR family)
VDGPREEPQPEAPRQPRAGLALWPSEAIVTDVIGRLLAFWGFRRNMGRVWAALYLSREPLDAQQIRELLGLSAGAVSMTLNELMQWGAIRRVWIHGERRDHFAAEVRLWKMIARVLSEREKAEIVVAGEACEEALHWLRQKASSNDPIERARAMFQIERIGTLYELAKLGKTLLEGLLSTAKLDLGLLRRFRLG